MAYFTTAQVTGVASTVLAETYHPVTAGAAKSRFKADASAERIIPVPDESTARPTVIFDIFLAYSSLDEVHVLGLYHLLKRRGYAVYVDRVGDPQLDPSTVSRETARILRYRIAQSRSLFVATSTNIPQTKWVPWELGFSDGYTGKAAVLPILDAGVSSFSGQEYFELYPEVRDDGALRPKGADLDIYDRGRYVTYWSN
jgi:hypothetical protein